jgi:hypothetical protein
VWESVCELDDAPPSGLKRSGLGAEGALDSTERPATDTEGRLTLKSMTTPIGVSTRTWLSFTHCIPATVPVPRDPFPRLPVEQQLAVVL